MIATPTPPITIKTIGVLLTPALYLCEAHRRPSPYPDIADNCAVSTLGELQQPEDNSISSCLIWDIWGFATKDNIGPTRHFAPMYGMMRDVPSQAVFYRAPCSSQSPLHAQALSSHWNFEIVANAGKNIQKLVAARGLFIVLSVALCNRWSYK